MIKKIDKLVISTFLGPFFITFSVVVFIFLMRFILFYFNDIIGKDIEYMVLLELLFFFGLNTFPIAIPLSILVSSLMCFGNLGEYFELTALKSAGISIIRILKPIFFFTLIIVGVTFWFSNNVLPWANLKGYSLLWDVKSTKTTLNIKEGIFYYDLPGYSIKVGKKFPDQRTLKNLVIYDHTENNANKNVILADSGMMYVIMNKKYLIFELFNGSKYMEDVDKSSVSYNYKRNDFAINNFKRTKIVMSLKDFDLKKTEESQFKHHQMMKTGQELADTSAAMRNELRLMRDRLMVSAQQYYFYHLHTPSNVSLVIKDGKWADSLINNFKPKAYSEEMARQRSLDQATNLVNFSEGNSTVIASKNEQMVAFDLEWHHKFTVAFSCIVMFLIGGSIGAIVKRGGLGVPVIIAIIFFIIMYLLTTNGDKLAKEGFINPIYGAWFSNVVLLSFGFYFLKKASEDSQLFEPDLYKMQFAKFKLWVSKTTFGNYIAKYLPV
ncbi:MAG: LptF/LptG family permease [Bacteroidota bacterium]